MAKLGIYYKKPQEGWMNLEDSEWLTNIYNANSTLYIGTKETRTLKEMVDKITKQLRNRNLIKQDEELEIDEFYRALLQYEIETKTKIKYELLEYFKIVYLTEKEGVTNVGNN